MEHLCVKEIRHTSEIIFDDFNYNRSSVIIEIEKNMNIIFCRYLELASATAVYAVLPSQ